LARTPRCLVASLDDPALDRATRHHLARVLRLRAGDPVELVDGRGGLARARWSDDGTPQVDAREPPLAPEPAPLWLAVAPPRPSRLDWLVEKAAELGVARLILLETEYANRPVSPSRVLRLQRKAHEALLQCRRLHALIVEPGIPLEQLAEARADADLWVAAPPPDGASAEDQASWPAAPTDRPLLVVVGPEGGLAPDESAWLASQGAYPVSLGSGVLRVETAALAIAARRAR